MVVLGLIGFCIVLTANPADIAIDLVILLFRQATLLICSQNIDFSFAVPLALLRSSAAPSNRAGSGHPKYGRGQRRRGAVGRGLTSRDRASARRRSEIRAPDPRPLSATAETWRDGSGTGHRGAAGAARSGVMDRAAFGGGVCVDAITLMRSELKTKRIVILFVELTMQSRGTHRIRFWGCRRCSDLA